MRKRSKAHHIDMIVGVLEALSYKAIKERQEKGETPIYIGGKRIGEIKREIEKPKQATYNCPNCCAPITKPYCEYCGTVFERTIYKMNRVATKEEIEQIKSRLYADDLLVYEAFDEFHKVVHELPPKLPVKKQR